MIKPNIHHAAAARKMLEYLLTTKEVGITYQHGDAQRHADKEGQGNIVPNGSIEGFVNASFADDLLTRTLVSRYAFIKNRAAITYGVKGQSKVASSPSDAELRALSEAVRKSNSLRKFMIEMSDDPTVRSRVKAPPALNLFEDNKSCIQWIWNPCQHSKMKHINTPLKDIRRSVSELHELDLCYMNTHDQLGDIMTKSLLTPKQHWKLSKVLMNIPNCDLPASLQK